MDAAPNDTGRNDIEDAVDAALVFLRLIAQPDDWIEIRLIPVQSSRWFQLRNEDLVRSVLRWAVHRNRQADSPDNVYVGINPRSGHGKRGDRNIAAFRAVFADFDGGTTPDEALGRIRAAGLPEPTIVIASGGGTHVYWMLAEPITDAAEWRSRMQGIIRAVKSDKFIANPERVMRLPGSDNVKPGREGRPTCRIVLQNDGRHSVDAFPRRAARSAAVEILKMPTRPRGRLCDEGQKYLKTGKIDGERRPGVFRIACDMKARGWPHACANEEILSRAHLIEPPLSHDEILELERHIANAYSAERYPGIESSPAQREVTAAVEVAVDGDPHSGGADLSRPNTLTDVGLARRLAKTVRGRLALVRERKMWVAWDGRRWAEHGERFAHQAAKRVHDELWNEFTELDGEARTAALFKFVKASGARSTITAMVALAESENGINGSVEEYDAHPWLLNVHNGVVDLRTGALRPHDPKLKITQLAAVEFVPGARSPLWERFIREVTQDNDELALFLQQSFGLALCGDVSDEVLWCHNGEGCNGKSTALEAVAAMLGDYAATAPPGLFAARSFDSHPTEVAGLRGKRFVTAIEQEANRALRESLVKSMTGGDTIRTRGMREDFWQMRPTWHIHIAYNRAPRLTGTDDGIRRRLRVVPWLASFKGSPDLSMKARLCSEAERPGILNWCLDGLRQRIEQGRLMSPECVMLATDDYLDDEDLIGRFLAERTESADASTCIELRSLMRAFTTWLEAEGSPRYVRDTFTANSVGREMVRRGYRKMRPDSGLHRKQTVIVGLRLIDTHDDLAISAEQEQWSQFA